MAELREVKLERIHPNPFRDIENYPFFRDKLDRLKESIRSTGQWPNIICRQRKDGEYELAFGHHRIQALKELLVTKVEIVLMGLSDDEMLRMMCDENAEEFGTNFLLGTMNAVSAVKTKLGSDATARDVGEFLGWTVKKREAEVQAADRVLTAWNALNLIELGVCKPAAFQGLGHEQAKAVVSQANLVYKARLRELEKDASEKEIAKAKAAAKKEAAEKVRHTVGAIKDGTGVREIKAETKAMREEIQPVATQRVKPAAEIDISRLVDRAGEQLAAWLEANEKFMVLYGKGAICDDASWTKLKKWYGKIGIALDKAIAKREE